MRKLSSLLRKWLKWLRTEVLTANDIEANIAPARDRHFHEMMRFRGMF